MIKVWNKICRSIRFIWNHPLVKNERLSAVIRYIKFHFKYRNGQKCIIPFIQHSLIITKGSGIQAHYFTYLEDFEEMLFLLHYLDKNDKFIDVGANIGAYSILASGQIGCYTMAFEPSIINYNFLEENVILNNLQDKIKLYNCALGDKNESSTIEFMGAMTRLTNYKALNLQEVMINKLDDFTDYSQLIKIDVEGYEEFVLNGASKILNHPKTNALIVELAGLNRYGSSNEIVHNILMENNFSPVKYSPYERVIKKLTSLRDDQFNTIYIRDEKLARKRIVNSPKYKIGNQWI